jgi:hypothetical protein
MGAEFMHAQSLHSAWACLTYFKLHFPFLGVRKHSSCNDMILILSFFLSLQQDPPLNPFVLWTARLWVVVAMPQLDQGALASKVWNDADQQHWPFPLAYSHILISINVLHCIHALQNLSFIDCYAKIWLYLWLNYKSKWDWEGWQVKTRLIYCDSQSNDGDESWWESQRYQWQSGQKGSALHQGNGEGIYYGKSMHWEKTSSVSPWCLLSLNSNHLNRQSKSKPIPS